ncbi:hypothetical protein NG798_27025, partial [Ancylothrix sp. C2]|uniref:hypothetical protein n=1 Tax=Ancylothrix sp. D3o TaxID=2953691 RepID=UPI0021BB6644
EYTNNDPKALSFFEACLTQHKHRLKFALGINVTPEYGPVRLIKHILERVAINFSGKQRRLASGERQRFYKAILPEATGFSLDVLKAYELRFGNLINQPENTGPLKDEVSQTNSLGNYSITESVTNPIEPVTQPEDTGISTATGIPTNTGALKDEVSQTSFVGTYPMVESVTNNIQRSHQSENTGTINNTRPLKDEASQTNFIDTYSIERSVTNSIDPVTQPENTGIPINTATPETGLSQTSLLGGYSIEQSVTNSIEPAPEPENTGIPPTHEPQGICISSVDPALHETIEGFTYLVRETLAGVYELDNLWQGICALFEGVVEDVWKGVWQLLNLEERQHIIRLQQGL